MKNIYRLLILSVVLTGCLDDNEFATSNISSAATIDVPGDAAYILGTTEVVELVIDATEFSDPSLIESVTVTKSFSINGTVSDESISAGVISTFPTTLSFAITDLIAGTSRVESELAAGDVWSFTYKVALTDGRILSPQSITNVAFTCVSELDGEFDYVTTSLLIGNGAASAECPGSVTGTVTWASVSPGKYSTTDLGFGQFGHCWGDSPANSASALISDICNVMTTEGVDQYGDAYAYTIVSVSGADLTIDFINTYGDGGRTVLTRKDGNDWPDLTN
jgi:hypothetical protein